MLGVSSIGGHPQKFGERQVLTSAHTAAKVLVEGGDGRGQEGWSMEMREIAGFTHVMNPPRGLEDAVAPLHVRAMQEGALFFLVSEWKPDADELQRLQAGESVFLSIMGTGMPPVMLMVGPEPELAQSVPQDQAPAGLVLIPGGRP